MNDEIIPINAFFDEGTGPNPEWNGQEAIEEADVILQAVVDSGEGSGGSVLRVGIDMETDELERLIALVRVHRGHDDYDA